MLISERFLLLLLNDRKGKSHFFANFDKNLGLAGAMILDLGFKGKVSISGKKLRILDYHASGDPIIDKILVFLYNTKKPLKLKRWLVKIARSYKKFSMCLYQRLENYGILTSGLKANRYYFIKPEIKQSLLKQIKQGMIDDMNPDIELLCLLSLITLCGFLDKCIAKEYRKIVRKLIYQFIFSNNYRSETLEFVLKVINMVDEIIKIKGRIIPM